MSGHPAIVLVVLLLMSGCAATDPYANGAPRNAGVADTGTYPNLNLLPMAAAPPLSEAEASAEIAGLQRVAPVASPRPRTPDRSAELLRLGRTHGPDAVRRIRATSLSQ